MDSGKDPQSAIIIEEIHGYKVDLGVVPFISWQNGHGFVRVEVPYDGTLLKKDVHPRTNYQVGSIQVTTPQNKETELLTVSLPAGDSWQTTIKSGKRGVITAEYELGEPADQLVSIDGDVLDDLLSENGAAGTDGIFGNIDAYNNPLALQFSLWVPDLLIETRPDELYELETMIRRGENTRQIFMPHISLLNFEKNLAENLSALANTAGGTLLVGVDRSGNIVGMPTDADTQEQVMLALLRAALLNSPPVPLWTYSEIKHPGSGRQVIRVEIPKTTNVVHTLFEQVYSRQGIRNSRELPTIKSRTSSELPPVPESKLEDIFDRDEAGTISFRNRDDIVVCNAGNGIKNLRLGAYLCGLINAGKKVARIIVTDLPDSTSGRLNALRRQKEDIEKILQEEVEKILPHLSLPVVEKRHFGKQEIAIIHLPPWELPVALYEGKGYIWQNPALNEGSITDLFNRYVELTTSHGQAFTDQDVFLEHATLNSPIRSPEMLETTISLWDKEGLAYDVEYQAQVWDPRPFKRDEETVGFSLQLSAPLRHISLTLDGNGQVTTEQPEVTGRMRLRLKDVLISGVEVTPIGNSENQWFGAIPVVKRTYLNIDYVARLNELFRRRRKSSFLRFLIPDVLLDRERVDDLAQVCADIGFRVYDKELFDTAPSAPLKATIKGIRGSGYYDIGLLVGLLCHRSELTRELHYDGWRDSKSTYTAMLDLRVKLWGTGKGVEEEIGRLQMILYQTISQRLQHLRTE